MSRFGTEYPVSRPTGVCAATSVALAPGDVCVATLCEREEDEGFDRLDFSSAAWESGSRPPRLFSYWRFTVPSREEEHRLLVDDSVLLDLFERMEDDDRPHRSAFRFVLALILMRKRLLKFTGRRADGPGEKERWLMQPRGADPGAPPIEVVNPRLSDDDVCELTVQLGEILRSEL